MNRIIVLLAFITISIWIAVFNVNNKLQIVACDVGQGDAILLQKNTTQILIDGGPNQKILDCLGKYMPFWDKTVELVFLTHPDIDHYGGLIDVFKNYKVVNFFSNGSVSSSQEYKVLESLVGGKGIKVQTAAKGMVIRVGMIYLEILNPLGKFETLNSKFETDGDNNQSVVILLIYDQFKALFTGDAEQEVSDLIATRPEMGEVNYLKVNHHGSKNGLTQKLLDAVSPEVAVISSGTKNRYGHPHEEIIKMLNEKRVKVLRTDSNSDINIVTNGITMWGTRLQKLSL